MDLLLSGKRALVTGGSRGIGKAVALALAREGVDVALLAQHARRRGVTPDVVAAEFDAANSTGRTVTAAEVADVVVFLASPRSRAINGDAIAVGGGTPRSIFY